MNSRELAGAVWRKSSYSGGHEGECVEVTGLAGTIGIRDSKNPGGGYLTIAPKDFAALLTRIASQT